MAKRSIAQRVRDVFKKKFSLIREIRNNNLHDISANAAHHRALALIRKELKQEPAGGRLLPGTMVTFRYKNPKTKDKLEFFDSFPLVVILGHRKGVNGERIEMGLNIHFFPREVRFKVLDAIYNIYKAIYDDARKKGIAKEINVDYRKVMRRLRKFNGEFALRSYLPHKRTQTFEITLDLWKDVVFIEPRFRKLEAPAIYKRWAQSKRRVRRRKRRK